MEIEHCGRTVAGDVVAFDIVWTGPVDDAAGALWGVEITSPGGDVVLLGYERSGGAFVRQYVEDGTTRERVEVGQDADLRDQEVTVRFPAERVGTAVEWPTWRAVVRDGRGEATLAVPV